MRSAVAQDSEASSEDEITRLKLEGLATLESDPWVKEERAVADSGGFATVTNRWRKRTRIPMTEEEKRAPLHSAGVGVLDEPALVRRMAQSTKIRHAELRHEMFRAPLPPCGAPPRLRLSVEHAAKLRSDGLAVKSTDLEFSKKPTSAWVEAFTSVEEKHEGKRQFLRQRCLMWTKIQNEASKGRYTPNVPLHHVSAYLQAVLEELGGTRDMSLGFYQIEIPVWARHRFRFMDEDGNIFELTRIPMGHRASPEYCQLLLSVLAGLPSYVKAECKHPYKVQVDIWLDNVRATGGSKDVVEYFQWIDEQAAKMNVTWKAADSQVGKEYTILGVHFNHATKEVSCGKKLADKLKVLNADATVAEVESMLGRLLHASAIVGTNPARWYWFLKSMRRKLSQVNRKQLSRGDKCHLPPSAQRQLDAWTREVMLNRPRTISKMKETDRRFIQFTDASSDGWGAVLVELDSGLLRIAGGKWATTATNISPAEVRGLALGVQAFTPVYQQSRVAKILCLVDNTSAIAAAHRNSSHSEAMNAEILRLQQVLISSSPAGTGPLELQVEYVPTGLNLADGPSRGSQIAPEMWRAWFG
jgi:hypothetical protein